MHAVLKKSIIGNRKVRFISIGWKHIAQYSSQTHISYLTILPLLCCWRNLGATKFWELIAGTKKQIASTMYTAIQASVALAHKTNLTRWWLLLFAKINHSNQENNNIG